MCVCAHSWDISLIPRQERTLAEGVEDAVDMPVDLLVACGRDINGDGDGRSTLSQLCPSGLSTSSCERRESRDRRPTCLDEVRRRWRTCHLRLGYSAFRIFVIMHHPTLLLVLYASAIFRIAGACSSRSTPRPRPPQPTMRPNITFQTYDCSDAYAKWYCLNGATCFSVKIADSILYNCECANGFVGQRCEFKDLEGSYLASRQQVMIETASIAGGVTLLVLILVIVSVAVYVHFKRRRKERKERLSSVTPVSQIYQPFSGFRNSHRDHIRPLISNDPEFGHPGHGDIHPTVGSTIHSASNRSRTVQ